jgi:hypothetical protein
MDTNQISQIFAPNVIYEGSTFGLFTSVYFCSVNSKRIIGNQKSNSSSSSSKVCPLYSGFPSPETKFRHLSLSLESSSVSPWFVMLRLTPSIHLSLGLPLLRVPSGSQSNIFSGSLFPFNSYYESNF